MAARVQLNNFRFSIYIDVDGTVTLTDLPPELREVVEALDPSHQWVTSCAFGPSPETALPAEERRGHQARVEDRRNAERRG